jgi:hypothetical protein
MDLSLAFNEVLARHDVPPISPPYFDIQKLDDFLQEAYRIVRTRFHTHPSPPSYSPLSPKNTQKK